ncbi:hypothetical protein [Sediminibacterium soli]|uniref:hypothetical protein n=1 Tax=Sediminibacterium soli TaxID=2698829 RepID=UPI00137B4DBA|nr:hypothetical protein [Sediminibacterium soli]NCI46209.1 hypothetical protein [Sediminibacterium soli]
MKYLLTLLLAISLLRGNTQTPAGSMQLMEAHMRGYAADILNADDEIGRFRADSFFTRALVQALKTPRSFYYAFDSLQNVSILYAPDSSFRIITWQVMKDFTYYRQKGAIQYNTKDGTLKLSPLFDYSAFTESPVDSVRDNEHWIGAVYYRIIEKTFNNRKYYTLLGYDENDARSTKKWIEVLTFDTNGKPQFGGRYFTYAVDDTKPPQPAYRFCLEFKKEANATLNYDPEMDMIVFAHLTSESADPKNKNTLVPFGSFEGFRWTSGKWVHVPVIREMDPRPGINPQQIPTPKENPELLQIKKKTKGS